MCHNSNCASCHGKSGAHYWIMKVLLVVGGLNWGLMGVGALAGGDWNVVNMLLGSWPTVEAVVYVLVGLAALLYIFGCPCKNCREGVCGDSKHMEGGEAGSQAPHY